MAIIRVPAGGLPTSAAAPASTPSQIASLGVAHRDTPFRVRPPQPGAPVRARAGPGEQGPDSTFTVDDARGLLVGRRATVSLQAVSGLDAT